MQATAKYSQAAAATAKAIERAKQSAAFEAIQLGLMGHFKRAAERSIALSEEAAATGDKETAWLYLVHAASYQEQAERAGALAANVNA